MLDVGGEYVRYDITEDQEGVDLIADFQVIDVNTCEPVPQAYLEIWHCNATGVYSGVAASGNGNSDDTSNLDKTFLRGIQTTDEDGVAQFHSIFPGYYTSRSVHIHTMVHTNISGVYRNHTLGNNVYASHVGQTFFDQDLITEVNTVEPYLSTTQELTTNADDGILSEEADEGVDPLMEYTYLGDSIEDGIFAWISYGINATLSDSVTPAAFYYESGGEENDDSPSLGGGGDAPGGNSTSS